LAGLVTRLTVAFTSTVAAAWAGETTTQLLLELQLTLLAFTVPNLNAVPAVPSANPLPVTVTLRPPATEPEVGLSFVTTGVNSKRSLELTTLVPPGVVTVMSALPAGSAGDTAVISPGEITVKLLALLEPKRTDVAPAKLEPVMATDVPPPVGPWFGDTR